MNPTSESGPSESAAATRARLEQELATVRDERATLAAELRGEDPQDADGGDSGDAADILERSNELAVLDRRITEIHHLIAGLGARHDQHGLPDGSVATLRFPDGAVATFRLVEITEEADAEHQDEVVTLDSPLGLALAGARQGDTITYLVPDGEASAEVLALQTPAGPRS